MSKQSGDADGPRPLEFLSEIRRRCLVQVSVCKNSQLELDLLRHLQSVQLREERSGAVINGHS